MKLSRLLIITIIVVFTFCLAARTVSASILQPGPSYLGTEKTPAPSSDPNLSVFVHSVKTGAPDQIMGVYVRGVIAYSVVQQPKSDTGYVSQSPDTITQFDMAAQYHSIGLLAHDFLAGAAFSRLQPGTKIILVSGDGSLKTYQVYAVQKYQALSPSDPYSNFVDLSDQTRLTADQLFYQTYGLGNSTLILQTCISIPDVPSWGRLFVLAHPVAASQPTNFWDAFSLSKHTTTIAAIQ